LLTGYRVLTTGVTGQVGSAVARYLAEHNDVVGVARRRPGDGRTVDTEVYAPCRVGWCDAARRTIAGRYPGTAAQSQ
jgi:nucleoside-diphosphate-sugar epimerase